MPIGGVGAFQKPAEQDPRPGETVADERAFLQVAGSRGTLWIRHTHLRGHPLQVTVLGISFHVFEEDLLTAAVIEFRVSLSAWPAFAEQLQGFRAQHPGRNTICGRC